MPGFYLHVLQGVAAPNASAGAMAFAAGDGTFTPVLSPCGALFGRKEAVREAAAVGRVGSDLNGLGRESK